MHYTAIMLTLHLVTVSGLRGQLQTILQCFPTNLRALNSMSASLKSVDQQLKSFDRICVSQHENLLPTEWKHKQPHYIEVSAARRLYIVLHEVCR